MTITWADLMAPDLNAAKAFYGGLFRWEFTSTGRYEIATLHGQRMAGIGQIPAGSKVEPGWIPYFGSEDAEASAKAIVDAGGTLDRAPTDVGTGVSVLARDPARARFGVWQPREGVPERASLAWCEVNTPDAEAARAFYTGIFGLEAQAMEGLATAYFILHRGDDEIGGILQMTKAWEGISPAWTLYFEVDDVNEAAFTVAELGGKVEYGPFDSPYGRIAVIRDSQGLFLSLLQRPA